MYVGNYDFWYESSQLMQRMMRDQNRKAEEKIKELQNFIQRFSANKSKSRQATSRKKLLDKITVEEMPASSRRYPYVGFTMDRELGKDVLTVSGLTKTVDGVKVLDNVTFTVGRTDKVRRADAFQNLNGRAGAGCRHIQVGRFDESVLFPAG